MQEVNKVCEQIMWWVAPLSNIQGIIFPCEEKQNALPDKSQKVVELPTLCAIAFDLLVFSMIRICLHCSGVNGNELDGSGLSEAEEKTLLPVEVSPRVLLRCSSSQTFLYLRQ